MVKERHSGVMLAFGLGSSLRSVGLSIRPIIGSGKDTMRAKLIDTDYYEVVDGEKWYSAKLMVNGRWFVTNHRGRGINQGSAIHRRVVAAIASLT
jgi:hypothetical protein